MTHEEHIYADLTDGTTEDVWGLIDPDKHPSAYVRDAVRELVSRKRGRLPDDVQVKRFSFEPAY
jgi:hypothetical protein